MLGKLKKKPCNQACPVQKLIPENIVPPKLIRKLVKNAVLINLKYDILKSITMKRQNPLIAVYQSTVSIAAKKDLPERPN